MDPNMSARIVRLRDKEHTPPDCFMYSKNGSGFLCLHGVAILVQQYGPRKLYKFIDLRHLTTILEDQNSGYSFPIPLQASVDDIITQEKTYVANKHNLGVPKALPPPRGRPLKGYGKRRKGWYERSPRCVKIVPTNALYVAKKGTPMNHVTCFSCSPKVHMKRSCNAQRQYAFWWPFNSCIVTLSLTKSDYV